MLRVLSTKWIAIFKRGISVPFYGVTTVDKSNLFVSCFHRCYLNENIKNTTFVICSIPILENVVAVASASPMAAWSMRDSKRTLAEISLLTAIL